jgi:hypothetical protein
MFQYIYLINREYDLVEHMKHFLLAHFHFLVGTSSCKADPKKKTK